MKYTPQLLTRKDKIGNVISIGVVFDNFRGGKYVGEIRKGIRRKMASGNHRRDISAIGEGSNPDAAADAALKKWNWRIG